MIKREAKISSGSYLAGKIFNYTKLRICLNLSLADINKSIDLRRIYSFRNLLCICLMKFCWICFTVNANLSSEINYHKYS